MRLLTLPPLTVIKVFIDCLPLADVVIQSKSHYQCLIKIRQVWTWTRTFPPPFHFSLLASPYVMHAEENNHREAVVMSYSLYTFMLSTVCHNKPQNPYRDDPWYRMTCPPFENVSLLSVSQEINL